MSLIENFYDDLQKRLQIIEVDANDSLPEYGGGMSYAAMQIRNMLPRLREAVEEVKLLRLDLEEARSSALAATQEVQQEKERRQGAEAILQALHGRYNVLKDRAADIQAEAKGMTLPSQELTHRVKTILEDM